MFPRSPLPSEKTQSDYGLSRLFGFSDGVFAIAITLLVLELKIPEVENATDAQIKHMLFDLIVPFSVYLFAFLIIGLHWSVHHRIFGYIVQTDGRLLWRNKFYLLSISFLPFPVSFMSNYFSSSIATSFFALSFASTFFTMFFLWRYASTNHRLLRPDVSQSTIRHNLWMSFGNGLIFTLSGLVACFYPLIAKAMWILTAILPVAYQIVEIKVFRKKDQLHNNL